MKTVLQLIACPLASCVLAGLAYHCPGGLGLGLAIAACWAGIVSLFVMAYTADIYDRHF